jgi:hypothetical protein
MNFDVEKTKAIHERMKALDDDSKMRFAINWRIPHSVFNVASVVFHGEDLQNIDWYSIHNSRDMGVWSHGGRVNVL